MVEFETGTYDKNEFLGLNKLSNKKVSLLELCSSQEPAHKDYVQYIAQVLLFVANMCFDRHPQTIVIMKRTGLSNELIISALGQN